MMLTLLISRPAKPGTAPAFTPALLTELLLEKTSRFLNINFLNNLGLPEKLDNAWIDFFEWFGNHQDLNNYIYTRSRSLKFTNQIALAYKADPSRIGLLNTLAILTLSGARVTMEEELLTVPMQTDNEKAKVSALLVRISQGKWDKVEAKNIAKLIMSTSSRFEYARVLVLHLSRRVSDRESLAVAVRDEILSGEQGNLGRTILVLNDLMGSRISPLTKPRRLKVLGLPTFL